MGGFCYNGGMKTPPKIFVIRKYITAHSAAEAIRKDKSTPVDDVWIDDDYKKNMLPAALGFQIVEPEV
jgi:hypothetical protein